MKSAILFLVMALLSVSCAAEPAAEIGEAVTTVTTTSTTVAPTSTAPPTTESTEDNEVSEVITAQDGDSVAVNYRGTLDDGSEFDSSAGRDPLTFVVGSGQVIAGFDEAVRGLAEGEARTVRIEPENAYGEYSDAAIIDFPADSAPEGLAVGDQVTLGNGQTATVVAITEDTVSIDANHPLAGKALTFEVELVSITR